MIEDDPRPQQEEALDLICELGMNQDMKHADCFPQSPVSDLESEWTVEKLVATKTCTAWAVRSLAELIGVVDRFDQALSITLKHNASLRQLREQKEEAERENVLMTDQINAQNIRYETLQEKVKPLVDALEKIKQLGIYGEANEAALIARAALAQFKPETKL